MAQYFQIGLSSPMTMEELMAFGGGENVQYFNINPEQHPNIDFQGHENQVVIDQATGQPVQLGLGFPQVLQHQQVVILTEAVENNEQMETGEAQQSQLPIASHEGVAYTYQPQQHQQQILERRQHLHQLQQQQQLLHQQRQQMECNNQGQLQTEQQSQQQFVNNTEASDGVQMQQSVPMEVASQELQGASFASAETQSQQEHSEQEQQQLLQLQQEKQLQQLQQMQMQQQIQLQQQQQQHQIGANTLLEQATAQKVLLRDWRRQKAIPETAIAAASSSPSIPQELTPAPSPQAMVGHMQTVIPVANMPPSAGQAMAVGTNQNQLLLNHMQNKTKGVAQLRQVQQFSVPVMQREAFLQAKPNPQFPNQPYLPAGRTSYGSPRRQYDRKRGGGRGRGRATVQAMNNARLQGQNYSLQMQVDAQTQAILSQHPGEAQSMIQRQQLIQQQRDQQVIIQNQRMSSHTMLQNQGNRPMVIHNAQSQQRMTHTPANQQVAIQNHGKQQVRLQYPTNHVGIHNQQAAVQTQQSPSSIPNQPVIIQRLPQHQHIRNVIVQPQSGPCNVIRQHTPHVNVMQQLQMGVQHDGVVNLQGPHQQEQIVNGPEELADSTIMDTKDEPPQEVIICMSPNSKLEVHNGGGFSLTEILHTLGVQQTDTGEYIIMNPEILNSSGAELEVRIDGEAQPETEVKQEVIPEPTMTVMGNNETSSVESRPTNVINEQENVVSSSSSVAPNCTIVTAPVSTTPLLDLACQPVTSPPPPENKEPKFVAGMYALCPYCGYTSVDFNHCQRCRKKIPEDCKQVPMNRQALTPVIIKKEVKEEKTISTEKFYMKVPTKSEAAAAETPKPKTKRAGTRKSKVKIEEPVILTLSSDEDGNSDGETASSAASTSLLFSGNACLEDQLQLVANSVRKKEPPVMKACEEPEAGSDGDHVNAGVTGGGGELDLAGLMDGTIAGSFTHLQCRTVRIGSYKVVPKEGVLVSSLGIKLSIPSLVDESKVVSINVQIGEMVKVLIHFGKGMPVIFIYCNPGAGMKIREALKMNSRLGPYYDPGGPETQRRITLLPNRMLDESKLALKAIFGARKDLLAELSHYEANEILVRASPRDVNIGMIMEVQNNPIPPVKNIMVFPPPPEKGGIPINTEDYACLGDSQFLNDVIIDFYLKYLLLRVLSPKDRDRTHVFSSFFYKRLTTRPKKNRQNRNTSDDDPRLSPAEKRHVRVKSWTKKVNIFEKDFIIIPINEHSHWFLAIICFPALTSPVRLSDNAPVRLPREPIRLSKVRKKTIPEALRIKVEEEPVAGPSRIPDMLADALAAGPIDLDNAEESSDRDEAEGEEEDLEQTSEDEDTQTSSPDEATESAPELPLPKIKPKPEPTSRKKSERLIPEAIKQPCILIFDSLPGSSRTRVVATLRDYLKIEYKAKMKKDRDFNKDTIKGATPKIPQQNNFYDCGLFVLQYVESFFQVPLTDYRLPLKQIKEWFPTEVVDRKREEIGNLLLDLMRESKIDVESLQLPKLTFGDDLTFAEEPENAVNGEENEKMDGEEDGNDTEYAAEGMETGMGGFSDEMTESVLSHSQDDMCDMREGSSPEMNEESLSETGDQIFSSPYIGASETVDQSQIEISSLCSSSENVSLVNYPVSDAEEEENTMGTSVTTFTRVGKRITVNQDFVNCKVKRLKPNKHVSRPSNSLPSSGDSNHCEEDGADFGRQ